MTGGINYETQTPRNNDEVGDGYLSVAIRVPTGKNPGALTLYIDDLQYRLESANWPSSGCVHAIAMPSDCTEGDAYIEDCITIGDDDCVIDNSAEPRLGTLYVRRCDMYHNWDAVKTHGYLSNVIVEDCRAIWVWDYTRSRCSKNGVGGDNKGIVRNCYIHQVIPVNAAMYSPTGEPHSISYVGGNAWSDSNISPILIEFENCHAECVNLNPHYTGDVFGIDCVDRAFTIRGGYWRISTAGSGTCNLFRATGVLFDRSVNVNGVVVPTKPTIASADAGINLDNWSVSVIDESDGLLKSCANDGTTWTKANMVAV
jgi:hypothetical protein